MRYEIDSKIKLKKKFKIPLVIISIIVFLIILLGIFVYFTDGNTKNVYSKIFEKVENGLYSYLDKGSNVKKLKGNIGINFKSDGALLKEEQSMMELFNALNIFYEIETDSKLKKSNIGIEAKYKQDNMFMFDINNLNNETFINLGSLYDKKIKLNEEDVRFTYLSLSEQKQVINEIIDIININLKEEYFYKEKEINKNIDKKVYTTKHTLEMNSKAIYDFKIGIIDGIKNSNKLLEFISEYKNIDKSQAINDLNSLRNSLVYNTNEYFRIDIYLNVISKKIEKVIISNKEDKVSFMKTSKGEYDITYTENTFANLVGHLTISNNELKFNFNNKKTGEIICNISENEVILNIKDDEFKLNINIMTKEVTSYIFEVIVLEDELEMKFVIDGTVETIDKVSDKIITNYIKESDMTLEDEEIIYNNLMKNDALVVLVEDFIYIYSKLLENNYMEYEEGNSNNIEIPKF